MYTICSMYNIDHNNFLKEVVLEMGWKILLKEDSKIIAKKLIGIDEFFLEICILNGNLINIKKLMKIGLDKSNYSELFSFINTINKNSFYGCYTVDEKEGYINFNYNFYLKNLNLNRINEALDLIRSLVFEGETLSKKISFGIHQILYSNYGIENINQCALIDTVGNA